MLVAIPIKRIDPVGLGSADSIGVGIGDDNLEYAMKDGVACQTTPHDEWFCTRLAETVGIACPSPHVLQLQSGDLIFGSRWEGGVAKDPWWDMIARGDIDIADFAPVLSRIFAFDCFVHNDDRHLKNYLVREGRFGWKMFAMDFSRAWLCNGMPPPPLPFAKDDNTLKGMRALRILFPSFFDVGAANAVLDKLAIVSEAQVLTIIDSHPPAWISPQGKKDVLEWWKSKARTERIDAIRKGIADGKLF